MGGGGRRRCRSRTADPRLIRFRAALLAAGLLPGVGLHDTRAGADPHRPPWSAMARLNVPGVGRCSAVFVAAHWAATAAHCLGQRVLGHVAPAGAVHVVLGYADGAFTRHLVPDTVRLDPGCGGEPERHRGCDLALLHFTEAVPEFLPPATEPVGAGTAVALGGYGQDRAERLLVDAECRVTGAGVDGDGRAVLLHGCNGTRGTSGGALVVRAGAGWRLAGVQVAGRVDGAGGVAVAGESVAALLAGVE